MEYAVVEFRHTDGPFEFADHDHEADWYPKDCIIKLFSRGVTAKSRPAVTDEKAIKASRNFVQGYISAIATPWTFIESLQHRTTKEEV